MKRSGMTNTLRRLVRPAINLLLAMAQFGPAYETEWPGKGIDILLRAAVAFPLILWALHDLRSNVSGQPRLARKETDE